MLIFQNFYVQVNMVTEKLCSLLTLNKIRVLPGLELHGPQACKRLKYTRGQVKYISIFIFWKCSGGKKKSVSVLIGVYYNLWWKTLMSCSCVFSLLTGSGVRPDLMTKLNHLWQSWFDVTCQVSPFVWELKR